MWLGNDHRWISGLLALALIATAAPAIAQTLPPAEELARTGPNADCEDRSCDQIQIDTEDVAGNRLDTTPAEEPAGDLFWGPNRLVTTADETLQSLEDSGGCGDGDVAKFLPGSMWECAPDAVDGGNADLLDGLDASDFARAGHLHDGRYYTQEEANDTFLDVETYDSDVDGLVDDADKLDGFNSSAFLDTSTYDSDDDGLVDQAEQAGDADTLDGFNSSDFWTKEDQTLQRLAGDSECDLGDVPAIINGIFGCRPDDVDGGNAETLDGFDSTEFSSGSGGVSSSTTESHSAQSVVLDEASVEKEKRGVLICDYRPSVRAVDGQPDAIVGTVLSNGDPVAKVAQTFHPGSVFHAGFSDLGTGSFTVQFAVEGSTSFSLEENPDGTTSFGECHTVAATTTFS